MGPEAGEHLLGPAQLGLRADQTLAQRHQRQLVLGGGRAVRLDLAKHRELAPGLVSESFQMLHQAGRVAVFAEEQLEQEYAAILQRILVDRTDPFPQRGPPGGRDAPQVLVGLLGLLHHAPARVAASLEPRKHVVDVALGR